VERGGGRVNHRGALLGPEKSGRPVRDGLVSLGHNHTGTCSLELVRVWWVAGAGSHQTTGGVHLMGVLFPLRVCLCVKWCSWAGVPARILRTV